MGGWRLTLGVLPDGRCAGCCHDTLWRMAATRILMCDVCGDVERALEWVQLALDASHEVRYRAVECQCSYRLVDVEVVVTSGRR